MSEAFLILTDKASLLQVLVNVRWIVNTIASAEATAQL